WASGQLPSTWTNSTPSAAWSGRSGRVNMTVVSTSDWGSYPGRTEPTTWNSAPDSTFAWVMVSNSSGAFSEPWTVLTLSSMLAFGSVAMARISFSSSAVGYSVTPVVASSAVVASAAEVVVPVSAVSSLEHAPSASAPTMERVAAVALKSFTFKDSFASWSGTGNHLHCRRRFYHHHHRRRRELSPP